LKSSVLYTNRLY